MAEIKSDIPVWNLELRRGDGKAYDLTVTEGIGGDGTDLTTATLWYTAKKKLTDPDADAVIAKTSNPSGGITKTNAALGLARISFTAEDTEDLDDRTVTLEHDLQMQIPGAQPRTLFTGKLKVEPDVTRAKI